VTNRFQSIEIHKITVENYSQLLPESLALQLEDFMPPFGSFDDGCIQRYLENIKKFEEEDINSGMTLANRLRLAFKDLVPDTICGKFPQAELPLKRRLRCVAEYLIRAGEFDKMKDKTGKLVKKRGVLGKLVVVYQPLPKLTEALLKQGLISNEPPREVDSPRS
jgi:hypothetical protein